MEQLTNLCAMAGTKSLNAELLLGLDGRAKIRTAKPE
jgi:hypothetical protein